MSALGEVLGPVRCKNPLEAFLQAECRLATRNHDRTKVASSVMEHTGACTARDSGADCLLKVEFSETSAKGEQPSALWPHSLLIVAFRIT